MAKGELKTDSKNANQSTERLFELVEFLCIQPEPMRISDIAKGAQMNISTVHRFLTALQAKGYAVQDINTGRYSLTFKFCRLGDDIRSRTDMRSLCMPYLHTISQEFGQAVSLLMEYDMTAMALETVAGPLKTTAMQNPLGTMAGLHCTAAGKLFLTCYQSRKLEQLMAVKGLPQQTANTITSLSQLRKELIKVRVRGYAFDNEESEAGFRQVAAPIKDYTNQVVGAVSVRGPVTRMTDEYIEKHLQVLLSATATVSARMGYEPAKDNTPTYRR
ncbi:MAG: IclR family transcriptional regulator [Angelakisella sp.]|nr:IclR family transcriptional regulator [Angelakisella sp.]